ncbi:exosortase F system-associated protein [Flavobacterium sp.]|uniref:exosortase F system-associated membrane protein n=1 Tax=Flavobacterium sp. TaxID=239 RepID=UPI00375179D4
MLKKILNNKVQLFLAIILILFLIAIRAFEDALFYDPLLVYYKSEYANLPLPKINQIKLFLSLGFRFYLNSILSLALLYVLFKDFKIVKFATFLYIILGSILLISFVFVYHFFGEENKMTLFYIRRFIIQPLFLMLFIPAFYYQKKMVK